MKALMIGAVLFLTGCAVFSPEARREKAAADHPEWPEAIKSAVRVGLVIPGMTLDQATASWGHVSDIRHVQTTDSIVMTAYWQSETGYGAYKRYETKVVHFQSKPTADGKSEWIATLVSD